MTCLLEPFRAAIFRVNAELLLLGHRFFRLAQLLWAGEVYLADRFCEEESLGDFRDFELHARLKFGVDAVGLHDGLCCDTRVFFCDQPEVVT